MTETENEPIALRQRAPKTRAPWRDNYDDVQERLGSAMGGVVRYDREHREIVFRGDDAPSDLLASGITSREMAYGWICGRLSGEDE